MKKILILLNVLTIIGFSGDFEPSIMDYAMQVMQANKATYSKDTEDNSIIAWHAARGDIEKQIEAVKQARKKHSSKLQRIIMDLAKEAKTELSVNQYINYMNIFMRRLERFKAVQGNNDFSNELLEDTSKEIKNVVGSKYKALLLANEFAYIDYSGNMIIIESFNMLGDSFMLPNGKRLNTNNSFMSGNLVAGGITGDSYMEKIQKKTTISSIKYLKQKNNSVNSDEIKSVKILNKEINKKIFDQFIDLSKPEDQPIYYQNKINIKKFLDINEKGLKLAFITGNKKRMEIGAWPRSGLGSRVLEKIKPYEKDNTSLLAKKDVIKFVKEAIKEFNQLAETTNKQLGWKNYYKTLSYSQGLDYSMFPNNEARASRAAAYEAPERNDMSYKRPSWCNKAKSSTEKAICSNNDIGTLDVELYQNYKRYKEILSDADEKILKKEQRAWLKKRNRCKGNHACLLREYTSRSDELIQLLLEFNAAAAAAAKQGPTVNNMSMNYSGELPALSISGNDDSCEMYILDGKIEGYGNCKHFINSKGVTIICTSKKKMCKTLSEVNSFISKY